MVNDKQAEFEKKLNNLLTLCGARQALYVGGSSVEVLESVDELIDQARDELLIQAALGLTEPSSVVLPEGCTIIPKGWAMAQPRRPVPGQADSKVPKAVPNYEMPVGYALWMSSDGMGQWRWETDKGKVGQWFSDPAKASIAAWKHVAVGVVNEFYDTTKTVPKGPIHVPDLVDPVTVQRVAINPIGLSAKTVDHLFSVLSGISGSPSFNEIKQLNARVWRNNSPILMALEYHKVLIDKTAQDIAEGMK